MSGNTEDMVKTIRYIVDTLEMRHPSKFAVAEEDDEFAHLFSHTTRRFVLRALCTLASAFDALTIAHQRDHNLLEQEDVEVRCSLCLAVLHCSVTNLPHSNISVYIRKRCLLDSWR